MQQEKRILLSRGLNYLTARATNQSKDLSMMGQRTLLIKIFYHKESEMSSPLKKKTETAGNNSANYKYVEILRSDLHAYK